MTLSLYTVQPGDQLFDILQRHYSRSIFWSDRLEIVKRVLANNPHIKNVDRIFPGQVISFPSVTAEPENIPLLPVAQRAAVSAICTRVQKLDPASQSLLPVFNTEKVFSAVGGGFISTVKRASESAISDVRKVGLSYYQMKAGSISENQYNYRRIVALQNADDKLGPLRKGFTPGKTAREAVRIRPRDAIRTSEVLGELDRLDRAVKLAKNGAIVLKVASLAQTGVKIHTAESNEERTVIVVDTVFSTAGAALGTAGAVLGLALMATPVGWVAIVGIAVAGIAGGVGGEMLGNAIMNATLFDENGNRIETAADRAWQTLYD